MIEKLKQELSQSSDYIFRDILVEDHIFTILFNEILTDNSTISDLIFFLVAKINCHNINYLFSLLPYSNVLRVSYDEVLYYINNGFVVLFYKDYIYAIEAKSLIDRGVPSITGELSLGGAKDSFSENINTNIGLLRKRIKSHLCNYTMDIGTLSKTKIDILYVDTICDFQLVENVLCRLKNISIDGILDSSYLRRSLGDSSNLFPTIMMSERPDKCCMALLEGKVVILVDTSPYALILPSFFIDFFHTPDDYYQKSISTSFIRIIRLFAFFIAIYIPAIYLSVTTRNYDLVPLSLLLTLKAGRSYVPFPAYVEAMLMMIAFEILKEGDLRKSSASNSSISILGGLILGDAAVAAGIVSPIMIIIIAISSISSLIFPSNELTNTIRLFQWVFLILSAFLGIYGVIIGSIFLFISLIKTQIFGYSYLSFDNNIFRDFIIKINSSILKRNTKLTSNEIRGRL